MGVDLQDQLRQVAGQDVAPAQHVGHVGRKGGVGGVDGVHPAPSPRWLPRHINPLLQGGGGTLLPPQVQPLMLAARRPVRRWDRGQTAHCWACVQVWGPRWGRGWSRGSKGQTEPGTRVVTPSQLPNVWPVFLL